MKRRYPLTLTEVVIALGLMSILLAALFSALRSATVLQAKGDIGREKVLARSFLHQRLCQVFLHAEPGSFHKQEDKSYTFSFDNEVDPDPLFSGVIKGRLYLDSQQRVVLATFSKDQATCREEHLLSNSFSLAMDIESPFFVMMVDDDLFVFSLPKTEQKGMPL